MSDRTYNMKALLTASLLLSSSGLYTQAHAESFQDAMASALQYHPSIEAAQATRTNIQDQKAEQESAYYPEINVTATGGRVYGDNATSRGLSVTRGSGYSYLWEGSVGVSQKIFDGFETAERIDAAEARTLSSGMDIVDIRENLSKQLSKAYLDVMRTKEALDLIQKHNAQINDYRGRITLMVSEGAADEAELRQAEDITILLDNILANYKLQFLNAQASYTQLTGNAPSGEMAVPTLSGGLIPKSLEEAENSLMDHPSLQSAEYKIEAGQHDISAEKAGFYPDVNGEMSYLKKDLDDVIGGEVVDARAVVKMNWNFSTGGGQFAKIRQKQAALFQAQAQKRQLERQLNQNLQQAWIEYQTASKVLENMGERRHIHENLFKTNKTQFEGAQIRLLQLMQSENQYFQARLEYINTKYRQKLSELSVLSALGKLQEAMNITIDDQAYATNSPFGFFDEN